MPEEIFKPREGQEKLAADFADTEVHGFSGILGKLGGAAKKKGARMATVFAAMTLGIGAMAKEARADEPRPDFTKIAEGFSRLAESTVAKLPPEAKARITRGAAEAQKTPKVPKVSGKPELRALDWETQYSPIVEAERRKAQREAGKPTVGSEKPSLSPEAVEVGRAQTVRMQEGMARLISLLEEAEAPEEGEE